MSSATCRHSVCSKCLEKLRQQAVEAGTLLRCPECRREAPTWRRGGYIDSPQAEQRMKKRHLVFKIINKAREDFLTTPEYDDYSEQREETVEKVCGGDKKAEAELLAYSRRFGSAIEDAALARKKRATERDAAIVEREGIFYELVKIPFRRGGELDYDRAAKAVHPLRLRDDLLQDVDLSGRSATNALPRTRVTNEELKAMSNSTRHLEEEAGPAGYVSETTARRILAELVGGFRISCGSRVRGGTAPTRVE
eukprot:GHVU01129215.1.p1 GENE.GHVU01129215.1~~GHVU01129215.1.p1  ORF type:complete len:289 (+),score=66.48 GHVU01129215.1:113-868(+)